MIITAKKQAILNIQVPEYIYMTKTAKKQAILNIPIPEYIYMIKTAKKQAILNLSVHFSGSSTAPDHQL